MGRQKNLVLVVEDDEEMNSLERELLEVHGLDTLAAFSGMEALEAYDALIVDAVLLDLMLPKMDGFETCVKLRQRAGQLLPIVMLTALDSEDCRRRGLEVGADAYFTKPFDPGEVVVKIRELLDRSSGSPREAGS